jgi:HSP20 family molecular chaperone IbpA
LEEETGQIALDVLENDKEIIIISPISWVEYDDIDLTLNKTVLTIKWIRKKPKEYFIWDIKIKNKECFWWKFIRNVILPENLEMNKIKAYMDTNLLIIKIPKLQFDSKTIKIDKVTI